jgi:ribonuclease R
MIPRDYLKKQNRKNDAQHRGRQGGRGFRKLEIAPREAVLALLRQRKALLTEPQLMHELKINGADEAEAMGKRLRAMCRDGQLVQNRKGAFGIAEKMDLIAGRVIANPDGFGFLNRDDDQDDLFLPPAQMQRLLHGDRVLACITGTDRRGRAEAGIVEILERANDTVVGRLHSDDGIDTLVPDNPRLSTTFLIPPGKSGDAKHGDVVCIRVTRQPEARRQPLGEVIEVLADAPLPQMAEAIALRSFSIPTEWPEEALAEAEELPDAINGDDYPERRDYRDLPLVTIDGATAKDFDDAVYCRPRREGGWRLIVAIADVAHYVQPDLPLDAEAQRRATSVYLPRQVVPMLPEKLSNGLCSLNPKVDRLSLVCEMTINEEGEITRSAFRNGVIRSHARLTYNKVWEVLSDDDGKIRKAFAKEHSKPVLKQLDDLYALFKVMMDRREERGALDFDSVEYQFVFGDNGEVDSIRSVERNPAHRIIEECMIAANVATAKFLDRHRMVSPYRVHDKPKLERIELLSQFLGSVGLNGLIKPDQRPRPSDFRRIAEAIDGRSDKRVIQTMLLRSQNMAVYQTDNLGHFGLALSHYTHFTSPIRRYPDLLVHRAIKHVLAKQKRRAFVYAKERMDQLCEHSSMAERRAEDASRDVDERLKCAYIERHLGDEMGGIVAGVTSFGLFVELDNLGISGLVHVSNLNNDYYHFDAAKQTLSGERLGRSYRLGDAVRVRVDRVDAEDRKIDLGMAEGRGGKPKAPPKGKRKGRRR